MMEDSDDPAATVAAAKVRVEAAAAADAEREAAGDRDGDGGFGGGGGGGGGAGGGSPATPPGGGAGRPRTLRVLWDFGSLGGFVICGTPAQAAAVRAMPGVVVVEEDGAGTPSQVPPPAQ